MSYKAIRTNDKDKDSRQCWRTPKDLFDRLHQAFNFTVDSAASSDNHLLPNYWSEQTNGLTQDWSQEIVFCNPPFSLCKEFLAKGPTAKGACFLFPVTALSTSYFLRYTPDYLLVPTPRVKYLPPVGFEEKYKNTSPSIGSVILLFKLHAPIVGMNRFHLC